MKLALFDCFSGISGDMCLGALVSAGWATGEIESLPRRLRLEGVRVEVKAVKRGPFAATRVDVLVEESKQPHRHLHQVAALIEAGELDQEVKRRAQAVFRKLAEAEAEVHGSTVEKVHFHEVGAADALVDVVGTVEGLRSLGVEQVFASPLRLGSGFVMSQHGKIPVPAPATALLLRGAKVEPCEVEAELVTPTGAALLAALVERWDSPPAYRLERVGTGAGGRDLAEQPNVLRVMIGEAETPSRVSLRRVAVLETALDDENPQFVAALLPRLLAASALDAMVVPSVMKKGRPGLWLVVIAELEHAEALARLLLTETSTLGVRVRHDQRYELPRRSAEVETRFGRVALKVATLPDGAERAVPEFESVAQAAWHTGAGLREVSEAALEAWKQQATSPAR